MSKQYVCVAVHTVKSGDTLYSISQMYDVPVKLLMQANHIRNPYNLRFGTKLCIPGEQSDLPPCGGCPDAPCKDCPDTPCEPGEDNTCQKYHRVVKGDTLYMIAKQHKVSLEDLITANPNVDLYNLQIGMDLCIPY